MTRPGRSPISRKKANSFQASILSKLAKSRKLSSDGQLAKKPVPDISTTESISSIEQGSSAPLVGSEFSSIKQDSSCEEETSSVVDPKKFIGITPIQSSTCCDSLSKIVANPSAQHCSKDGETANQEKCLKRKHLTPDSIVVFRTLDAKFQPPPSSSTSTKDAIPRAKKHKADLPTHSPEAKTLTQTSALISKFHQIQKQLSQSNLDPLQRQRLLIEQDRLGGLEAYQAASRIGGSKERGGETGKWCAKILGELGHGSGSNQVTLLDVGAISGTSYSKYDWIKTTSIDLNPQHPSVLKCDFFRFPIPSSEDEKFNVVALSLVLNFIGDLKQRSQMIKHAHKYLKPFGYLYIVLPLACLENSRYLDSSRFLQILECLGYTMIRSHNSLKLTFWFLQRSGEDGLGSFGFSKLSNSQDGGSSGTMKQLHFPKVEIRKGADRNNFCIKI